MSERDRLLARKEKLEARLAAIERRDAERRKKDDARRAELAGRAVLKFAESDPDFARRLAAVLNKAVRGKRDRALLGLEERPPGSASAPGA